MNSFIIFAAILGGGLLGLLAGVACFVSKERGNCEECGKNCAMNYFYIDGDCDMSLNNVDEFVEDDDDSDPECCKHCIKLLCDKRKDDSELENDLNESECEECAYKNYYFENVVKPTQKQTQNA